MNFISIRTTLKQDIRYQWIISIETFKNITDWRFFFVTLFLYLISHEILEIMETERQFSAKAFSNETFS